ncbi:hypothetical protein QYM36_007709 [Artemia franciscana]|uniref:Reverse transcriptase domain-containing protein n=1 Tax=Artemia franciscana TaxID=6661 RepID=A0AA88LLU0_ARTSF|nr:hypothetical protein QYM36_007709 [Artemia franciscana]
MQVSYFLEAIPYKTYFQRKRSDTRLHPICPGPWDPIDIILIDILKAFDRISLRKLIHCLEVYEIKGQLKNWLSALVLLNDRKIAVKVADTLSTWIGATSGVPQGSVLSPVLFVMYIDICINTISLADFSRFADDTKLLGKASASSLIQNDLNDLTEKLEELQLSPNVAK